MRPATGSVTKWTRPQLRSSVIPRRRGSEPLLAAGRARSLAQAGSVRPDARRSEDPTRTLPDELQADQDQEDVDVGVEEFARDLANQQHAEPSCEHGERKQRRRGEQVLTGELAQRHI